jgi:hypothetical protein
MEEEVVTETSLPERMGAKTESKGSLLWRTCWIYFQVVVSESSRFNGCLRAVGGLGSGRRQG